jgi:hypothetical protein
MNCANCGNPITDTSITEDSYYFCTGLCRYDWRQKGKPNPFLSFKKPDTVQSVTEVDLDFPIEPVGFEKRNLMVRPSYWIAPKLFLDGKQLVPTKKKFFSRTRDYAAISNFGKNVTLRLKLRPLDLVPILYVDGQLFQIARPLNTWEYLWISFPLILLFSGGAIGGLLGFAATYSNSILIRKLRNVFLRFLFTGATTVMAIIFYIRFVGFVSPYISSLASPFTIDQQIKDASIEMNKICPQMLDNETRLDSTNAAPDKILIYFYTLPNKLKSELNIDAFRQNLTPRLISNIRVNEQLQLVRDNHVTMVYKYFDKKHNNVLEICLAPYDYK